LARFFDVFLDSELHRLQNITGEPIMSTADRAVLEAVQGAGGPTTARDVIARVRQRNISEADARGAIWRLVDRHRLHVRRDLRLEPVKDGSRATHSHSLQRSHR
jgi:protein involved in polysaccharide export with SLBB domain